jgi:hypothetical protein
MLQIHMYLLCVDYGQAPVLGHRDVSKASQLAKNFFLQVSSQQTLSAYFVQVILVGVGNSAE